MERNSHTLLESKGENWCARRDSNLRRFAGVSEAGI